MRLPIPSDLKSLLALGLSRSMVSMTIKVATAGLTYLTYVVLARTMDPTQYGYFAFGLSLAMVLAVVASMGQQNSVLRFFTQETANGNVTKADLAVRAGASLIIGSNIVVGVATLIVVFVASMIWPPQGGPAYLYATAFLILPLSLADFHSAALRSQGSVWTALVPRDIVWRLVLPLIVLALFSVGVVLNGAAALLLCAAVLAGAIGLQYWLAARRPYVLAPARTGVRQYWNERGAVSRWFLAGSIIDIVATNVDVILVGILVAAESAGVYFNAMRTAALMTLFNFAMALVIAPMVSQHFHKGEMRKAQAVMAIAACAGFVFSLSIFAIFIVWGGPILSLFGQGYEDGYALLVIISLGLLCEAATGQARTLMQMTGHERVYVKLLGTIVVTGVILQIILIPIFGLLGAAIANMATRSAVQIATSWWCIKKIGIDPTILGIFKISRVVDHAPDRVAV